MGAELQGDKKKDKWTFTFVNVGDFYIRECVNINNMRYITKLYGLTFTPTIKCCVLKHTLFCRQSC